MTVPADIPAIQLPEIQLAQLPSSVPATLTRGARRRLLQRERKKEGKLERARLAKEEQAGAATLQLAGECQEVIEDFDDAPCHTHAQDVSVEVPTFMEIIDVSLGLDILVSRAGRSSQKMDVPLCAVQLDVKPEQRDCAEIAEVDVKLPVRTRQQWTSPREPMIDIQTVWADVVLGGEASSSTRASSSASNDFVAVADAATFSEQESRETPQSKLDIKSVSDALSVHVPVVNTFVHFGVTAHKATARPRSLSV